SLCVNDPEGIDCFALSQDGHVRHRWRPLYGAWTEWEDLGGFYISAPAATMSRDTRVFNVFAIGADSHVYYKTGGNRPVPLPPNGPRPNGGTPEVAWITLTLQPAPWEGKRVWSATFPGIGTIRGHVTDLCLPGP